MAVSENSGTPKSSILIGFSIINHPFWGSSIFGNTHIYLLKLLWSGDSIRDLFIPDRWRSQEPNHLKKGHKELPGSFFWFRAHMVM